MARVGRSGNGGRRSRSALPMTDTERKLMAAAAIIGRSVPTRTRRPAGGRRKPPGARRRCPSAACGALASRPRTRVSRRRSCRTSGRAECSRHRSRGDGPRPGTQRLCQVRSWRGVGDPRRRLLPLPPSQVLRSRHAQPNARHGPAAHRTSVGARAAGCQHSPPIRCPAHQPACQRAEAADRCGPAW